MNIPATAGAKITDLVSGQAVAAQATAAGLSFVIEAAPMQLDAFLITDANTP